MNNAAPRAQERLPEEHDSWGWSGSLEDPDDQHAATDVAESLQQTGPDSWFFVGLLLRQTNAGCQQDVGETFDDQQN